MIQVGSRYEKEDVYFTLDGRSNITRPTVMRTGRGAALYPPARTSVRWQTGVRLDRVANRTVGSPEKWWLIMEMNSEVLDPMALKPGMVVNLS